MSSEYIQLYFGNIKLYSFIPKIEHKLIIIPSESPEIVCSAQTIIVSNYHSVCILPFFVFVNHRVIQNPHRIASIHSDRCSMVASTYNFILFVPNIVPTLLCLTVIRR